MFTHDKTPKDNIFLLKKINAMKYSSQYNEIFDSYLLEIQTREGTHGFMLQ